MPERLEDGTPIATLVLTDGWFAALLAHLLQDDRPVTDEALVEMLKQVPSLIARLASIRMQPHDPSCMCHCVRIAFTAVEMEAIMEIVTEGQLKELMQRGIDTLNVYTQIEDLNLPETPDAP